MERLFGGRNNNSENNYKSAVFSLAENLTSMREKFSQHGDDLSSFSNNKYEIVVSLL